MKMKSLLLLASCSAFLIACGQKESSAPASTPAPAPATTTAPATPAPAPAAAPTETAAADNSAVGKKVYGATCSLCHGSGVAGAPKVGDKADWGPRIAQGNDVMYKHAIEGFTGAKGMMPARGGGATLTDEEVKAAVDYMVAQSR